MAMDLLSTVSVGSGGIATIQWPSIPQFGKDLLIKVSARTGHAVVTDDYLLSINSSTTNFSGRQLFGNGSSVSTVTTARLGGNYTGANATANSFSNVDLYITNYASNANKAYSINTVSENNATAVGIYIYAGVWSDTNPITSITLTPLSSTFEQGSIASLYIIS